MSTHSADILNHFLNLDYFLIYSITLHFNTRETLFFSVTIQSTDLQVHLLINNSVKMLLYFSANHVYQYFTLSTSWTQIKKSGFWLIDWLTDCMIDWKVFYALSAILQPCNGGMLMNKKNMRKNKHIAISENHILRTDNICFTSCTWKKKIKDFTNHWEEWFRNNYNISKSFLVEQKG